MQRKSKRSLVAFLRVVAEITWYALFVAIAAVVVAAVLVATRPVERGSLTVHASFIDLTFERAAVTNQRLLVAGSIALTGLSLAVAQVVVGLLRRVFAALRDGHPFAAGNARLVRAIGIVVITGSLLSATANLLLGLLVMRIVTLPGIQLDVRAALPAEGIFLGLVILVLGEVFGHGASLQEDQDLTV